jgi:putative nucleotidyltransferase with HDIG domain
MTFHETPKTSWRFPGCPEGGWTVDFDALVARYGWLRALAGCGQDPVWHAEGDVLTHVGMVCRELVGLRAWRELAEVDRQIVFAAALLHDVGKPACTALEDGRVRSRGHSLIGARMARRILSDMGAPFAVREQVVALARQHGLPGVLLDRAEPERAVITAAVTVRCNLLAVLAEADARGRVCLASGDDAVERVGLFGEVARECGCWDGPYRFASDYSRLHYLRTPGTRPTVDVFDPTWGEVVVMSGLPAAGKDTWVGANVGEDVPVISLDEVRDEMGVDPADEQSGVIAAAKEVAKGYLRARQGFAWNATYMTRFLREGLISLFVAYGARVKVVYCEAPLEVMRERNARRDRCVPWAVIDGLFEKLDLPDEKEGHRVEYVISGFGDDR